jgi:hypothetical protein
MLRGECIYCKADTGPCPGIPWIADNGIVFDKTSTVCEKCKPIVERQIEEVRKGNLDIKIGD